MVFVRRKVQDLKEHWLYKMRHKDCAACGRPIVLLYNGGWIHEDDYTDVCEP